MTIHIQGMNIATESISLSTFVFLAINPIQGTVSYQNRFDYLMDDIGNFVQQSSRICLGVFVVLVSHLFLISFIKENVQIVRNYLRSILGLRKLKISERRCIDCKEKLELMNATETDISGSPMLNEYNNNFFHSDTITDMSNKIGKTKEMKKKNGEKIDLFDSKAGSGGGQFL